MSKLIFSLRTDSIKKHRYASIDDWWDPIRFKDFLIFNTVTADTGNMDYNFCILMHALVEQYLCYRHGISDKEVTHFDTHEGKKLNDPGQSLNAPYHFEHMSSNGIEFLLAQELGIDWDEYGKVIDETLKKWKSKSKRTGVKTE